jgi:hypothetical protein
VLCCNLNPETGKNAFSKGKIARFLNWLVPVLIKKGKGNFTFVKIQSNFWEMGG